MDEDEDFLDERDRIDRAPDPEDLGVPGLTWFAIETEGPVDEYAARLRTVLGAALDRGLRKAGIDTETEPRPIPEWFTAVCDSSPDAPGFARRGAERFVAAGHGVGWALQGWLDEFDPDYERAWSWWDLTRAGDRTVSLWIDAHAEDFFPVDELRWAAYTAGAVSVAPHELRRKDAWLAETSI